ncbi:MAG TPA: hypothetical protein PLQ11_06635, partial [Beijerinckiaceae bacterium]|nr:hypothetical protein [Beijerinckiaceae bacterium]
MTARDPVRVAAEAGALDIVVDPALIAPEGWRCLDLTRLGGVTIGGARISARFAAMPAVAGGA